MFYNPQSPTDVAQLLERLLRTNPHRSVSGIFKALRKDQRVSAIGDYPLLAFILRYGHSRIPKYHWARRQVLRAIRISGFYLDIPRKHAYIPREWEQYLKGENGQ